MLKKLRKKIILMNLALVGIILLAVFGAVCANADHTARAELELGLRHALDEAMGWSPGKFALGGAFGERREQPLAAWVLVTVDESGEVLDLVENNATLAEPQLSQAVAAATAAAGKSGLLRAQGLAYLRAETPEGLRIIFADSSQATTALLRMTFISGVLFVLCLGALLLISVWLSGIAVRPIQRAWDQQKQFVADASHELKTPLTVILANNNILLAHQEETIARQRQWLESTGEEAVRMRRLIDEMLTLAKADARQVTVALEALNVSRLVEEELLYFEPVAYERESSLESRIQPDLTARGNSASLRQLIQILLDNAVKHGQTGTPITVSLSQTAMGVELSVNNRGPAIPQEELPHLFDRFYRADKAREEGGYGLGLAIAKSIAQTHQARLTVTSNGAEGTTFRLSLPLI